MLALISTDQGNAVREMADGAEYNDGALIEIQLNGSL